MEDWERHILCILYARTHLEIHIIISRHASAVLFDVLTP